MRQLSVQSVWCSSQWGSHMRRSNLCRTKQISLTGHWLQVHVVTLWPSVFKVHAVHHSENEALSAFHYGALWLMSGHVYPEIMQEGAFSFKGHDPLSSSINQFPGQNSRTWERQRKTSVSSDWTQTDWHHCLFNIYKVFTWVTFKNDTVSVPCPEMLGHDRGQLWIHQVVFLLSTAQSAAYFLFNVSNIQVFMLTQRMCVALDKDTDTGDVSKGQRSAPPLSVSETPPGVAQVNTVEKGSYKLPEQQQLTSSSVGVL